MKKILFTLALFAGMAASAQVKVGDNPTTVNANAVFEMESTTKGLLLPRMTTAQRAAITSPAGLQVYDTTTNTIWYHNGTAWVNSGAATTVSNSIVGQNLTTTVNGVASTPVTLPPSVTASNGLTATSGNVTLGGALTAPTTVSGLTATNKLALTGTGVDMFNVGANTLSVDGTNNFVGVNRTAALFSSDKLGVDGTGHTFVNVNSPLANTSGFRFSAAGQEKWTMYRNTTTNDFRLFSQGTATDVFSILYATGNVGIGTTSPAAQLHTTGTIRFAGAGTPGAGKVLTSDASGNATWQTAASAATASNGLTAVSGDVRLGGTLSATTAIALAGNQLNFTTTGTANAITLMNSALTAGQVLGPQFGKASTANNSFEMRYSHVADGDATNRLSMGLYGNSTAFNLLGNGYVGLGTTSPDGPLTLRSNSLTTPEYMSFGRTSSEFDLGVTGAVNQGFTGTAQGDNWIKAGVGNMFIGTAPAKDVVFMTTSLERMRITSGGNIGIGTSSPAYKLDITGIVSATTNQGGSTSPFVARGTVSSSMGFNTTSGAVDNRLWDIFNSSGTMIELRAVNDANSVATTAFQAIRSGNSISQVAFPNGNICIGRTTPITASDKVSIDGGTSGEAIIDLNASAANVSGLRFSTAGAEKWHMYREATTNNFKIYNATTLGTSQFTIAATTGFVGVGATAPTFPLDVQTTTSVTNANYGYLAPAGAGTISGNSSGAAFSIRAYGRIVCPEFNAVSDRRIKDVIGLSNSSDDLDLLNKIKITDYEMKDKVQFGDKKFKKVIAQELEQVFPQVVNTMTNYVPNIYQMSDKVTDLGNNTYKVTFKADVNFDAKATGQVKLYDEKKDVIAKVVSRNNNEIVFTTSEKVNGDKLFVYGEEVTDFRAVDYEALTTLNISATQELYKQIQELKAKNEKLTASVAKVEKVQAEYAELSAQVKELKAALGVTAQK